MPTQTVVLIFGGRSSEHTISCATAGGVLAAIDRDKYTVIPVGITRDGAFVLEDDNADKFTLNPSSMPEVVDNGSRIQWPDSVSSRELSVVDASGERRSLGEIDEVEEDLLDRAWGLEPTSRLSCQAVLSREDITIEIPKYSINHAREKH